MGARILHEERFGFPAVILESPGGSLSATFHPTLNMLCSSLLHEGEELLYLRDGVAAYAESGKTCGMPLLHPWANRLSEDRYRIGGKLVVLIEDSRPLRRDANGLPNHGLLGGRTSWEILSEEARDDEAEITASFRFAGSDLLANFPFPHEIRLRLKVRDGELEVLTLLRPTSAQAVPVSFGWHPYFRLPNSLRENWTLSMPVRKRLLVDSRSIPTGATEPVGFPRQRLGNRSFDDGYTAFSEPHVFCLEGGGRKLEIELDRHYPYVQVYSPADAPYICIEPMTAPTNALVSGEDELDCVEIGKRYEAIFRIRALTI